MIQVVYKNQKEKIQTKNQVYKNQNEKASVQYDTRIEKANLEREANSKLTPQASKGGLIQRFREDIGYLVLGNNMVKLNIAFFLVVSQEMVPHV